MGDLSKSNNSLYLILGYYGARNAGDDMMLFCIKEWLHKQTVDPVVISECPEDIEKRFGLKAVKNVPLLGEWGWPKFLLDGRVIKLTRTIIKCHGLIVGGGDLIRDDGGFKNFLYTIEKCLFAILFRKKIFLINVGIGIPNKFITSFLLKIVLNAAKIKLVRDIRSYEYCTRNKISNTYLTSDIVFTLPAIIEKKMHAKINYQSQNYFVVTLRGSPGGYKLLTFDEKTYGRLSEVFDEIIRSYKLECVFIPFQCSNAANDNHLHQKVYSLMKNKEYARILEWTDSIQNLCVSYSQAKFIIGMRLHSIILGLALNKKCIVIPYDIKCIELCKMHQITSIIDQDLLKDTDKMMKVVKDSINTGFQNNPIKHYWSEMSIA